ncbi:DUF1000-domain-containing protein [Morchella conica CCBAS932]|uniref:DUF1000-domain-containing protein n=1 Tax=Morchella conica CCBAS932 TaxID=1392247 RepID=A0A3N4KZ32_9PEZI|nr:DUF1000-domain-containing protein [Morchella conica CCBAS932]
MVPGAMTTLASLAPTPMHHDDLTPALQSSLYQHIEFDKITTLNETVPGAGMRIVKKTWDERLDSNVFLESDVDEQLLMFIPFTGTVKLHSIIIRSPPGSTAPKTVKIFINRDDLDFSSATDLKATQTLELPLTGDVIEMPVKRALFQNTRSLTLFFEKNFSEEASDDDDENEEVTKLSYLGFKGTWTELRKEAVVANYEAAANPADHKNLVPGANYGAMGMGGHNQGF